MTPPSASSNSARAERAKAALHHYVEAKGEVFESSGDEVCDLVADLLHLTRRLHSQNSHERNPEQMLAMAQMHFDAEISDPEEEEEVA
jgi:hypothetical protein